MLQLQIRNVKMNKRLMFLVIAIAIHVDAPLSVTVIDRSCDFHDDDGSFSAFPLILCKT